MKKMMQVVSMGGAYGSIKAKWVDNKRYVSGRQIFYHPDCEIYLVGRNTVNVQHVIMQTLQEAGLAVRDLRFVKGGL